MSNKGGDARVFFMRRPGARTAGDGPLGAQLEALRPELLRFALWLARDRALAEDIVQESLIRAWGARERLEDASALKPWLLTIVRREHARLYERKRLELVSLDEDEEHERVADSAQPDGELELLRSAILCLPLEYREPLIMQVQGGFTTAEIASELGLSTSAVLTRLFRARHKLRAACGLPADDAGTGDEPPEGGAEGTP